MGDQGSTPSNRRSWFAILLGLAVLGVVGFAAYFVWSGRADASKALCSICGRPLHKPMVYVVASRSGARSLTCCPRCGLRFAIEEDGKPMQATDLSSEKLIPAENAVYVEGSNFMKCCTTTTTLRPDMRTLCELHFDRCLPSLVAFSKIADAQEFQRQHEGHLLSFAEARLSVARQMGRPLDQSPK